MNNPRMENLAYQTYECEYCHIHEHEDIGSWNRAPYMFFCSALCHELWDKSQKPITVKTKLKRFPVIYSFHDIDYTYKSIVAVFLDKITAETFAKDCEKVSGDTYYVEEAPLV